MIPAPGITGSKMGLDGSVSVKLVEIKRLVWKFFLSVTARQIVSADPSLGYTVHVAWIARLTGTPSDQENSHIFLPEFCVIVFVPEIFSRSILRRNTHFP